jgi:hypothetical protein
MLTRVCDDTLLSLSLSLCECVCVCVSIFVVALRMSWHAFGKATTNCCFALVLRLSLHQLSNRNRFNTSPNCEQSTSSRASSNTTTHAIAVDLETLDMT